LSLATVALADQEVGGACQREPPLTEVPHSEFSPVSDLILSHSHYTTMTISITTPSVRAARRLRFVTVRAMNFILFFLISKSVGVASLPKIEQLSKSAARRWESTGAEPPPPDGHLPSIASSKILRSTRDAALRTPGIKWLDEHGSSPLQNTIGGRETRKMNVYQAVRDAMG
jgi:hypothetical protein